jgi:ParB family chromosome partitioning protein
MATRDEFDDFFGDEDDAPANDTRADGRLLRVPLGRLTANLVNPRRDFGTDGELLDLGKSLRRRQIQACPAVSRSAYLKLWPDHAERVGDVDYVLVTGGRRFRGAKLAGNPTLNCVIDDAVAQDRKTFMEAVVSENVDRQNFNPIEEAYAVQGLVAEFGSNRAVAQHFDRVDGWVTQRVLLTHLAPDVQSLVREKEMPLEAARSLGKLARDSGWNSAQQLAWWEEEQRKRATAAAGRKAARKSAKKPGGPPSAPAAPPVAPVAPVAPEGDQFYDRKTAAESPVSEGASGDQQEPLTGTDPNPTIPEQAAAPEPEVEQEDRLVQFPYGDGVQAAHHLIRTMPPEELDQMLNTLIAHRSSQGEPAPSN